MPAIDDLKEWLVSSGVYETTHLPKTELVAVANFVASGIRVDCYCPGCKDSSTFAWFNMKKFNPIPPSLMSRGSQVSPPHEQAAEYISECIARLGMSCARNASHRLNFWLTLTQDENGLEIRKIGQDPSPHDLAAGDLRKYGKLLERLDMRELKASSACHAVGYHVAALVYLRRVFERRLEAARAIARNDDGWDDAAYAAQYFTAEKIAMLEAHLPRFLVENRALYSILSKGIHELGEAECEDAYEACRVATLIILDEEIERRARAALVTGAAKSLAALQSKLGGGQKSNETE